MVVVVLVVFFVVLPLVELAVIVAGAEAFGVIPILVALVLSAVAGIWLMKHEGLAVWRRANDELAAGRVPAAELVDGAMVLGGGTMLFLPGFLTDVVGLLLLVPPVRAWLRPFALRALERRAARAHVIIEGSMGSRSSAGASPGFSAPRFGRRGDVVDTSAAERPAEARVVRLDVDEPGALGPGQ